jgi:hypothetical protein
MLVDQQGTGIPPSQLAETHLDNRLVVDLAVLVHRTGVELENLGSHLLIQEWHLDFAVEPAGAHQCGIKRVWSVSRQDELCAPESQRCPSGSTIVRTCVNQSVGCSHCMTIAGCRMRLRASVNVCWVSRSALVPWRTYPLMVNGVNSPMKMTQCPWPRVYPNISCMTRADFADVLIHDSGEDDLRNLVSSAAATTYAASILPVAGGL